jgi:flagellar biogenesis protein FliO
VNPGDVEVAAVAQVAGSVGMFGVIWIVQVVHYPLMRFASSPRFTRFETGHRLRISWVVGPAEPGPDPCPGLTLSAG